MLPPCFHLIVLLWLCSNPIDAASFQDKMEFNKCPGTSQFYNYKTKQCENITEFLMDFDISTLIKNHDFSFLNNANPGSRPSTEDPNPNCVTDYTGDDEKQWKMLAFGLISIMVVVATVIIIIGCHHFRKYHWLSKTVTPDSLQGDDAENGYVVIHRFTPAAASPDTPTEAASETQPLQQDEETHVFVKYKQTNTRINRLTGYRPKRRMMNEYVDDVFESDDSRSIGLPTILEKPEGCSPSPVT